MIAIGRNKKMTWGITAALNDISDLWQEELSADESQYKVDGEWRDMEFVNEVIKVKGEPDHILKLGLTHRGPIVSSDIISGGSVLFGGAVPKLKKEKKFSFGWGFSHAGDSLLETINLMAVPGIGVKDFVKIMDKKESYIGLAVNLILADTDGDIGYMMLSP